MDKKKEEQNNFEENIEKLEQIVLKLENGNLSLDESIALFEDGMKYSKVCKNILDSAQRKITILINKDGEIAEKEFEDMKIPN